MFFRNYVEWNTGEIIMTEIVQVLSQLLWDMVESEKNQRDIFSSFYKNLILRNTNVLSSKPILDILENPLKCIIENKENMAEEYMKLCAGIHDWPYDAFLTALIEIMEKNQPWAERWERLTARQKQNRKKLLNAHSANIEKLYASNIIKELRPAVDHHKKIVHDYYRMHLEREQFIGKDHYFINLKGMSSSTPILYNNTFGTRLRGGGFYFRWNMYGIVVDPGLHFVTNMHECGLGISDIDAVIITHDHLDHMGDMLLLDDLEYQIKEYKTIQWYVCREVYEAERLNKNNMHLVSQRGEYDLSPFVSFKAIETRHIKSISECSGYLPTTFGCVFTLKAYKSPSGKQVNERVIGYTSDTTYWDGMEKDYDNTDMLIANISSVRENDLLMEEQNELHLGFSGCVKMLLGFSQAPRFFLLSEFWNGIEDIRFPVSKQLRRTAHRKGMDTTVVPAELGMEIDLACMGVRCSSCGTWAKKIFIIKPNSAFGEIYYVCENCAILPELR